MTPGAEMEKWLNEKYGENSELYQDLSRLIKIGVEKGWEASQEIDGPNYRRNRIPEPSPETFQFSITAVYMNSKDPRRFKDDDESEVLRGQYHGHPYGELNLVVRHRRSSRRASSLFDFWWLLSRGWLCANFGPCLPLS
jgi:hypothetical protein